MADRRQMRDDGSAVGGAAQFDALSASYHPLLGGATIPGSIGLTPPAPALPVGTTPVPALPVIGPPPVPAAPGDPPLISPTPWHPSSDPSSASEVAVPKRRPGR